MSRCSVVDAGQGLSVLWCSATGWCGSDSKGRRHGAGGMLEWLLPPVSVAVCCISCTWGHVGVAAQECAARAWWSQAFGLLASGCWVC